LKNYCFILILCFLACNTDRAKKETSQLDNSKSVKRFDPKNIDTDFNSFLIAYSTDSAFQIERTKFPLYIKQYDVINDKDTIFYRQRSEFKMMDFRQKTSQGSYDEWKQQVVLDEVGHKATIEIRGIENGIMVNYEFEKINNKWVLVAVDDAST
jgi:hypothetical protein